jgi:hypothetical protein
LLEITFLSDIYFFHLSAEKAGFFSFLTPAGDAPKAAAAKVAAAPKVTPVAVAAKKVFILDY